MISLFPMSIISLLLQVTLEIFAQIHTTTPKHPVDKLECSGVRTLWEVLTDS